MRICPSCKTTYPDGGPSTCSRDGAVLMSAREHAAAMSDPMIGTTIAGRYEVVGRVGVGGMGTVYRATQRALNREVAIKILKKELSWDQDTVTRFHREAKAMSLLTHPNTVRVFDFGETEQRTLFFAMELLEGELLTTRLDREGALDIPAVVRIGQQILRSLAEAHSKGIIHRDLKPDNIFLAQVEGHPEPVVKVLDFGIAKVVQGDKKIDQLETQAGTVFGTPRYMSPEQAQGKPLDARSDLYSVGILLYQMLVGQPPFRDEDAVIVMAKHIRERPVAPKKAAPERTIPPALERIVLRVLEKDPSRRFQSGEDLDAALEGVLQDYTLGTGTSVGSAAQAAHATLQALSTLPRRPIALASAVLLVALGVAIALLQGSDPVNANPPVAVATDASPESDVVAQAPAVEMLGTTLHSDPSGAEVWIDGSLTGTTPLTIRRPAGSEVAVEFRLEGHGPHQAQLVVDGEDRRVALSPITAPPPPSDATPREGSSRRATRSKAARRNKRTDARMRNTMQADGPYERW